MARRTHTSIYFADDKDVYDLLLSSRRQLSSLRLAQILRRIGILLSPGADREGLIRQLTLVPLGWQQLTRVLELTDTGDRAEKFTGSTLGVSISTEHLAAAIQKVKQERVQHRDEVLDVSIQGDVARITVVYSEVDTTQTRLCQKVRRELSIEIEKDGESLLLRHQAQPRAQEIIDQLREVLAKDDELPEQREVELSGVTSPERRTEFFLRLIKSVDGFEFNDVHAVRVHRLSEAKESETLEDDESDEEEAEDVRTSELKVLVRKAALEGERILDTPQYKQLLEAGFFVHKLGWSARQAAPEGMKVGFEAEFGSPEEGRGFRYRVSKVWERGRSGDFKKTPRSATSSEVRDYGKAIEAAAQESMVSLADSNAAAPAKETKSGEQRSTKKRAQPRKGVVQRRNSKKRR